MQAPIFATCQEIYDYGFQTEGVFLLDVSGSQSLHLAQDVYCKDGRTYILTRGQYGNRKVLVLICF